MSQRVKTSARGLVLPRSSSPENGHLRKNYGSAAKNIIMTAKNSQGTIGQDYIVRRAVQKNHCEYIDCLLYGG
jgi:hypothetical protein